MRNYKRAVRPGFTLYHEDVELLLHLPLKQFKEIIMALLSYSEALAKGEEPGRPEVSGWAERIWPLLSRKIARDHEEYVDKCERQRLRKVGATAVVHGEPRSLTETETVTETETENETVTVAGTEAGAEASAVGREAYPPALVKGFSVGEVRPVRDGQGDEGPLPPFIPPTVEEVSAFCRAEGYAFDAQRFVDYYASKGWLVGSTPMVDWRAAVRTWASREQTFTRERGMSAGCAVPPQERMSQQTNQPAEVVKPKHRDPAIDQANAILDQWHARQAQDQTPLEGEALEKQLAIVRGMLRDAGMQVG